MLSSIHKSVDAYIKRFIDKSLKNLNMKQGVYGIYHTKKDGKFKDF